MKEQRRREWLSQTVEAANKRSDCALSAYGLGLYYYNIINYVSKISARLLPLQQII